MISETGVEEDENSYVMIIRFQISKEAANEIIEAGGMPTANTLVTSVTVDKTTGEARDDFGQMWQVWD